MAKYRKKPVVIEAFKFYVDPMPDWFMDKVLEDEIRIYNCDYNRYSIDEAYCKIKTLEGVMQGNGGDYIIKGVQGEIYPCKSDIFEMTYEPINKPRNLTVDVNVQNTEIFKQLADGLTKALQDERIPIGVRAEHLKNNMQTLGIEYEE